MAEQLTGTESDKRFFEVCYPMHADSVNRMALGPFAVSTDANACESWAMRWAREQGLRYEIAECADKVRVRLYDRKGRDFGGADLWLAQEYGEHFKEAFVRACCAAGEILNKAKGGA